MRKTSIHVTFSLLLTTSIEISTRIVFFSAKQCKFVGLLFTLHEWTFLLWYLLNRIFNSIFESLTTWNRVFSLVNDTPFKLIDASDISFDSRQKVSHDFLKTLHAQFRNSCSCPHNHHRAQFSLVFLRPIRPISYLRISQMNRSLDMPMIQERILQI